eukprot:349902-Chlamydomonas_euryale.AAC.1
MRVMISTRFHIQTHTRRHTPDALSVPWNECACTNTRSDACMHPHTVLRMHASYACSCSTILRISCRAGDKKAEGGLRAREWPSFGVENEDRHCTAVHSPSSIENGPACRASRPDCATLLSRNQPNAPSPLPHSVTEALSNFAEYGKVHTKLASTHSHACAQPLSGPTWSSLWMTMEPA